MGAIIQRYSGKKITGRCTRPIVKVARTITSTRHPRGKIAARGNSNCIQQTASAPKSRRPRRRHNAFLPRGWGFEYPWNPPWNRLPRSGPTITTGKIGWTSCVVGFYS